MDLIEKKVEEIVKLFVTHPQEVETYVENTEDEDGEIDIIHIKTHKSDIGRCIGKGGGTAEALRKIIGLMGYEQLGKRVYVKIDAPQRKSVPDNHFNYGEEG